MISINNSREHIKVTKSYTLAFSVYKMANEGYHFCLIDLSKVPSITTATHEIPSTRLLIKRKIGINPRTIERSIGPLQPANLQMVRGCLAN